MNYQAIVFDKDGTLLDFNRTWLPIYRHAALEFAGNDPQLAKEMLAQHGYDHATGQFIGGSLLAAGNNHDIARAWSALLPDAIDNDTLAARSQRLNQTFQQRGAQSSIAVPGLQETLYSLKQSGLKLAIATSDSYAGIHHTLQAFEILRYFDFLCGYDSGYGIKPEPGMVLAFCESVSIPPAKTIVVGDNRHDIEMGRNAGAGLCIGVLTGTSTRRDLQAIADLVLNDISQLPDIIN